MSQKRDVSLDFAKGWCVLGMLIHHTLNSFPLEIPLIKYARFVTGAFPFLAGFIVAHHYLGSYNQSGKQILPRLLMRSCRLLILFVGLNFITKGILAGHLKGWSVNFDSVGNALSVLFVSGDYRRLDFELLVPIAYTLVISGVLVSLFRRQPLWIHVVNILLSTIASMIPDDVPGTYYLRYTAVGVLGVSFGLLSNESLEQGLKRRWYFWYGVMILHLPFLPFLRLSYPVYALLVIMNLGFAYSLGSCVPAEAWLTRRVVNLGKYSLLSYLFQVAVLRVLSLLMGPSTLRSEWLAVLGFCITTAATSACVELLRQHRVKGGVIDRGYRWVFE